MTIEELRKNGWIAFEYVRGSHAYGTNIETSDEDRGGVFICPPEYLLGLRSEYIEQVSDETNDTVFYEFGRWIELLLKSNPTALEGLFVPKDCIVGDVHPSIQYIIDHRDFFLSRECFKTLTGYAVSQIGKARGLNKKIVNPVEERKSPLDFCYIPYNQGTTKLEKWLNERGLKQKYCGLVALPNMPNAYGLYYDWGTHLICEYGVDLKADREWQSLLSPYMSKGIIDDRLLAMLRYHFKQTDAIKPYGFTGIVKEDGGSCEVRTCTVPKDVRPIAVITYNKSGYESHCKDYLEYNEWVKKRNPVRYENNLGHNYDSKNLMHCMRLTRMGKELAMGKGFNVRRTEDRGFLLAIRNHEYTYEEIIAMAEKEKALMEEAMPNCPLPPTIDKKKVNELLINARKKFYSVD